MHVVRTSIESHTWSYSCKILWSLWKIISKGTITKIKEKYKIKENVENNSRVNCDRAPIYYERDQRIIVRKTLLKPMASIRDLALDSNINPKGASKSTLHNILLAAKVISRVLSKRQDELSRKIRLQRILFALKLKKKRLGFSNFFRWSWLFPTKSGNRYVYMKKGQSISMIKGPLEVPTKKITIKVFGFISSIGVGPLIKYQRTMNKRKYSGLLKERLFQEYPFLENADMAKEWFGDPPRLLYLWTTTLGLIEWKSLQNGKSWMVSFALGCPPKSPDLNIIENIWSCIQDKLYQIKENLGTSEDTWRYALNFWIIFLCSFWITCILVCQIVCKNL